VEQLGRSSVRYRLAVFAKKAEEAAAEGFFVHVYVGRESRRPVELPQSWREKLEQLLV
jgi:acyl-CoA thioester hydrolase